MLGKGFKLIILIVFIIGVVYLGACVFGNTCGNQGGGTVDTPDENKARYSVYVENTGNIIFTNSYKQYGSVAGKRIYRVYGYWEIQGNDFKFKDSDIILDESIFGIITIRER